MMSDKLDWTEKLGDAVLAQQADVMDAIQRLRTKAQANGKLETTEQQTVRVTQEAGQQVIKIEPASPDVVYEPALLLSSAGGLCCWWRDCDWSRWGVAYAIVREIWDDIDKSRTFSVLPYQL
jgi:uncharacterized protein DUF3300